MATTRSGTKTSRTATSGQGPSGSRDGRPLLVILDSHGIIYRAYHALRDSFAGRTRTSGEPTWAVYGYANSLLNVLDSLRPTHVIAAWDGPEATFRHKADVTYKATREPMPDDLRPQIERVRDLLNAFRIPVMEMAGFEADDVLGTLARQAAATGVDTVLVTLDNDIVQLIGPHVRVFMYRPYQHDSVIYDEAAVRDRWGFEPERMVDYKALVGDTSDNIPGVAGIGEKGAKALIEQWGTVEVMLEHLDEIRPPRTKSALEAGREAAMHSKHLATIVRDVPGITLDLDNARVHDYDRDEVITLFRKLEFQSLTSRLPPQPGVSVARSADAADAGTDTSVAHPSGGAGVAYIVVTTDEALAEVVSAIRAAGRFGFELVADDPHPMRAADHLVGIGISTAAGSGWYIPFGHRAPLVEGQQSFDLGESEQAPPQLSAQSVLEALRPLLLDPAIERVAHNAKHAMVALAEAPDGMAIGPVAFDTQIAAYLLGTANASLHALAFNVLGREAVESKTLLGTGRRAVPFSRTSIEECATYAAGNADLALQLAKPLAADLGRTAVATVFHEIDLPHAPVLARMERWGIAMDIEVLAEIGRQISGRIEVAERAAYDAVGHEFLIGSPKELSTVLFEELGLPKTRKTATGYTTDADALAWLRTSHPVIDAVLQWRELTKIRSTYLETLPQQVNPRTGRVHSVFSQVTAATGRLSSNDPNLQNIPVRGELGGAVRRAFVARDCGANPALISFDYSQIELRVLAHVCGDRELRRAFAEGQDIHAATASRVFGVPLGEVTTEQRRRAKVFNFGVLYGLTDFGLSQRENIGREEAATFIRTYFEAFPAVQAWREATVVESRERGYAETLSGRRRYIPELRASNRNERMAAERIAINMPIQGTAADIIKIAMNRIDAELLERQRRGALARLVLQVHDELIFEAPESEVADIREIAFRLMPSLPLDVPLDIDEKRGRSWGDME